MTWRPITELKTEIIPENEVRKPTNPASMKTYKEKLARAKVLPNIIPTLERFDVEWSYQNFGYQFRFSHGPILCWWPRTGVVYWQGKNLPSGLPTSSIEDALEGFGEALQQPPTLKIDSTKLRLADLRGKPVCLVCGGDGVALRCEACASNRDDLCNECWKIAHWCP